VARDSWEQITTR